MRVRKEIQVSGIVQGVGFRPYVYHLATDRNLGGNICNTPYGVAIEIQGAPELVEDFLARLSGEPPALAQITGLVVRDMPCLDQQFFEILPSRTGEHATALISPDVAVCDECLHELFDLQNRRYGYPFINCTNCGPRFTIVRDIPYDRPGTSMAVFPMCARCHAEYDDPRDRRFHAQPNACWDCGPRLEFWDARGRSLVARAPITAAADRLRAGEIVAVKGLGGFHLAVDATNGAAVDRLRRRKRRVEKPFAVMVRDLDSAGRFCEIDAESRRLLAGRRRPIVLLPRRQPAAPIADGVASRQRDLGVFLPYTPLHHLLFAAGDFSALVMTSGNLSEEPIAIDNREAVKRLSGIADFFLVHDREILLRCDDSVVRFSAGKARQIRRSRGSVPAPVRLREEVPPILAVGGELKNTICLTHRSLAFLGQHVGDLENAESFAFFRESVTHLSKILEIEPEIVAYDLHPDYLSTKWALQQKNVRLVGVQHHHAHIAACMAENQIGGRVIGLALDGAGYGLDGRIWGGEAIFADYRGFERAAHFAYVPLPGGAAAIREPWRMALSYLAQTFGESLVGMDVPFVRDLDRGQVGLILQMISRGVNSPLTSSCGRLFDAVAAILGIRQKVTYEAQAAIDLEMVARASSETAGYPLTIRRENGPWQIDTTPLFAAVVEDLRRRVPAEIISRRFHNGLVETLARLATLLRDKSSLNRVCLSGGTFNNALLFESLVRRLEADEFEVYTHSEVPTGDGGLSLGQALVAAERTPEVTRTI
ncbi:MAG TPA: carbamoyltransferase HypF [Candidatus Baltobacteraceae bacterium]|nr:carbamoyltransferase HypF [Candidatus Baltobacteraceae bacterium]